MKLNRERFLAAVMTVGLAGAVGCGDEPAPAEAEPVESTGGEEMGEMEAPEEPMAEEEAAPEEPMEPEVEETGPTPE
jgi:hypothetical protein